MAEVTLNFTVVGNTNETGGGVSQNAKTPTQTEKDNAKVAFTVAQAQNIASQFSNNVVDNSLSLIGLTTGNTVMQTKYQETKAAIVKGASITASFIANPILGAVHLTMEAAATGVELYEKEIIRQQQNISAGELRRRAGYTSNGNR